MKTGSCDRVVAAGEWPGEEDGALRKIDGAQANCALGAVCFWLIWDRECGAPGVLGIVDQVLDPIPEGDQFRNSDVPLDIDIRWPSRLALLPDCL
jgi:hypothetical protein